LVCRWSTAGERPDWRVPLQFVTAALFQPVRPGGGGMSRVPELSFRQFREDTVILRDGKQLTGVLEDVGADSIRMETAVGAVSVEAARVAAIALDSALVRAPAAAENSALVMTKDGAWLTLHEWTVSETGELAGRTSIGIEFRAPLADVVKIACYGPDVVDLTTRTPIEMNVTPFISRTAEMLVNRNVRGGFLRLEGRESPRGFGMTSGMSATFAVEPGDRQFRATVGLDDMVGDAGSVEFALELDGRRIFTSPMLTGADAAVVVGPLDIAGGERLTLTVEFAEYGNVQDVANWCDVVIVR
ncbi:MAG: NPCBM/NEW2 domain-containing protein, partial [Pirellulales bacterium]